MLESPQSAKPQFRRSKFRTKQFAISPSRSFRLLLALIALMLGFTGASAHAQLAQKNRRETSANRKARIARTIDDTYTHRWEVAGGGGFLRFRSGPALQKNSEIAFWMNTTYYLNQKLGITGEVRGAYGNAKVGNNLYNIANPQISEYPFMAGPTYRLRTKEKTSIGVFAMGGTAVGKFDGGSKGIPAADVGMWPSTNARAAFSAGANFDVNVYANLALRVAPAYTGTTFGGTVQNNFGFNIGAIYRFGRQK